jgi:hypothetical protein
VLGLPYGNTFDTNYILNIENVIDDHYSLVGYTNTWLFYSKALKEWRLELRTGISTYATTNTSDYPIGLHKWNIHSLEFNGMVELNINSCVDKTQYNCKDGGCISIKDRYISSAQQYFKLLNCLLSDAMENMIVTMGLMRQNAAKLLLHPHTLMIFQHHH